MGVTLIAEIVQQSGTFYLVKDTNLYGSHRSVADNTERDDIPDDHRKAGMTVYTQDSKTFWVLGSGLTDSDWFPILSHDDGSGLDILNSFQTLARFHDNGIYFNNRVGGWVDSSPMPFRWISATIVFSSADYTLGDGGDNEIGAVVLICAGTMGGARSLILPDVDESWFCIDAQQATHNVTAKKSGGTGVTIPAGFVAWVRHDGFDYVLATLINSSSGGSGAPAGSDNQFQYNNGGAMGGASGLTYYEPMNRPVMPNGYEITAGGFSLVVSATPTAARAWTIPDATDTVVGKATTDILTNKTYSLSGTGNVFTDTSIAQYDLVMANSTPAFKRFAKGSNNTVLGVSSGGVLQYAAVTIAQGGTGVTALPGSDTYVFFNDSAALGADSGMVYAKSTDILTLAGALKLGSGNIASAGEIRADISFSLQTRNNANSADIALLGRVSGGDEIVVGGDGSHANQADFVNVDAVTAVITRIVSTNKFRVGSTTTTCHNALTGMNVAWGGGSNAQTTQAMADANQTPTSSVILGGLIETTGALTAKRDLIMPLPTDAQGYFKIIKQSCTGGFGVRVKCSSGSSVDPVGDGKYAILWFYSGGVVRITADT